MLAMSSGRKWFMGPKSGIRWSVNGWSSTRYIAQTFFFTSFQKTWHVHKQIIICFLFNCVSRTVQSRTCTDYMGTLFDRFRAEHPDVTIGRTTFFSLRPPYITKSSSLQSFGCLCQTHENTGLLLKSLNSLLETKVSVSPDTFYAKYPDEDSVNTILQELDCDLCPTVTIRQWQSIVCPEDGKKRTKVCASQVLPPLLRRKSLKIYPSFAPWACEGSIPCTQGSKKFSVSSYPYNSNGFCRKFQLLRRGPECPIQLLEPSICHLASCYCLFPWRGGWWLAKGNLCATCLLWTSTIHLWCCLLLNLYFSMTLKI